jgi:cation diffusion facilitator family transporter
VNVVAAGFALVADYFSSQPADLEHPYGHGKMEHFSATFEGGLIALAAVLIAIESTQRFISGTTVQSIDLGIAIGLGAGILNGLLGWFLIRSGRRHQSVIIEADGHHLLSDFWTSVAVSLGLVLVRFTGLTWLDPLMALIMSAWLAWVGFKLIRRSLNALLDAQNPEVVQKIVESLAEVRKADLISVHHLRVLESGRYKHVDLHLVLPAFYSLRQAHERAEHYDQILWQKVALEGELHSHIDPCDFSYCKRCAVAECPIRKEPCQEQERITADIAMRPK